MFIRYLEIANKSKPTRNGTFIYGNYQMKLLLPVLIFLRMSSHDGIFTDQRRFPTKKQPPEIRRVERRQGKQHFRL
jgi:hypothetical protein